MRQHCRLLEKPRIGLFRAATARGANDCARGLAHGVANVRTDLIAARADRRPHSGDDVGWPDAVMRQAFDRCGEHTRSEPPPARMDRGHPATSHVGHQHRHTVRRLDGQGSGGIVADERIGFARRARGLGFDHYSGPVYLANPHEVVDAESDRFRSAVPQHIERSRLSRAVHPGPCRERVPSDRRERRALERRALAGDPGEAWTRWRRCQQRWWQRQFPLSAAIQPSAVGPCQPSLDRAITWAGTRVSAGPESFLMSRDPPKEAAMTIRISANDKGSPAGKLADAELHFDDGPLEGLKLIGFSVWERRNGPGRQVTFPSRQYSVNGERRSFALLRPLNDLANPNTLKDAILAAYAEHEAALDAAVRTAS